MQTLLLKSIANGHSLPVSLTGFNKYSDQIEISGIFASKNNLPDCSYVTAEAVDADPGTDVFVDTVSAQDSNHLHQHKDAFEWLMTQITIVCEGMIIPVNSSAGVPITISVLKTIPSVRCVRLQKLTKLHFSSPDTANRSGSLSNTVFSFLSSWTGNQQHKKQQPDESFAEIAVPVFPVSKSPLKLRVRPCDDSGHILPLDAAFHNTVMIHGIGVIGSNRMIACLTHLLRPSIRQQIAVKVKDASEAGVREVNQQSMKLVLVTASSECPPESVILPDSLIRETGIRNGDRVCLSRPDGHFASNSSCDTINVMFLNELRVKPLLSSRNSSDNLLSEVLAFTGSQDVFLTQNNLLTLRTGDYITDIAEPCAFISSAHLTSVIVEDAVTELIRNPSGIPLPLKTIREAGFLKDVTKEGQFIDENVFLKERLQLSALLSMYLRLDGMLMTSEPEHSFCSILVSGPKGCGKNSLITSVLNQNHHNIHVNTIDCKNLHGKRLDSVHKYLMKEVSEAVYQEPAVIILRDLDFFIPSQTRPEEENSVETVHVMRCTLILVAVMKRLQSVVSESGVQVVAIATARSEDMLFPTLFDKQAFNHYMKIPAPTQQERFLLIKCYAERFMSQNDSQQMSEELVDILSKKSEGFYPSDLGLFMEQCTHLQMSSSDHRVKDEDVLRLISSFQPISQRGISLMCKSKKQMRDVGGLQSIKKAMQDTLFLPLKYPALFRKCPLRPHSCLLLYGVPGTGKTLLAEAIANECGVNFLSVEGPELLSKYIGASEEAVRDLFQRAKSVKPCIIFFDEFDSIAPRRGQDSTGVTDRVVNQLLTQMDGVEELDRGIFILAATSRPDLLDPALLRPGRFDKRLRCTLPDRQERRQILDIICRNISLQTDVDLDIIADQTEFYSGADLQAIFFTAQVAAAHEHLRESLDLESGILQTKERISESPELDRNETFDEFSDGSKEGLVRDTRPTDYRESQAEISMSQVLEAIGTVRCSVTEKERRKYDFM